MTCDQIEELLSDLLDDELSDGVRAGVESHLAACEHCAEAYRALRRTVRFVRAHSRVEFRPNTPGAAYRDFTRAIVDEDYGRTPIEVLVEALGDLMPPAHNDKP